MPYTVWTSIDVPGTEDRFGIDYARTENGYFEVRLLREGKTVASRSGKHIGKMIVALLEQDLPKQLKKEDDDEG